MEHAGKVVSRDAIMTKLWESDSFIDDNTLTVNITPPAQETGKRRTERIYHYQKGLGYMV
ncbi:MAG: helix-turn-helix domain-containing protein [Blautia wexlerae]